MSGLVFGIESITLFLRFVNSDWRLSFISNFEHVFSVIKICKTFIMKLITLLISLSLVWSRSNSLFKFSLNKRYLVHSKLFLLCSDFLKFLVFKTVLKSQILIKSSKFPQSKDINKKNVNKFSFKKEMKLVKSKIIM